MSGQTPADRVAAAHRAEDADAQRDAYAAWATAYEADLFALGYRLPAAAAAVFARVVAPEEGPILDVGCGTGLQVEPLAAIGYGPIIGVDLAPEMLEIARAKGIYAELRVAALGPELDLGSRAYSAAMAIGVFTNGHAPASAFRALIQAVRPGGAIVLSLRDDPAQDPAFAAEAAALADAGLWRPLLSTAPIIGLPHGDPTLRWRIHAFETLG